MDDKKNTCAFKSPLHLHSFAQSAGAVEYTNYFSAEG